MLADVMPFCSLCLYPTDCTCRAGLQAAAECGGGPLSCPGGSQKPCRGARRPCVPAGDSQIPHGEQLQASCEPWQTLGLMRHLAADTTGCADARSHVRMTAAMLCCLSCLHGIIKPTSLATMCVLPRLPLCALGLQRAELQQAVLSCLSR